MSWDIIEVHFEGTKKRWRAVLFNEARAIIKEQTFDTRVEAEIHVRDNYMEICK
jgi:hypothetical protein|tara:strand:+ start:300 stop:461 length:162 start_codon:yes stop_codon:yes gene_type:complete